MSRPRRSPEVVRCDRCPNEARTISPHALVRGRPTRLCLGCADDLERGRRRICVECAERDATDGAAWCALCAARRARDLERMRASAYRWFARPRPESWVDIEARYVL